MKRGGYWQPADYICRLLSCTGLWKVVRPGMERWAAGECWPDAPEGRVLAEGRLRFAL